MTVLLRVGTKVRTTDRGARIHGRSPDKPEAIGIIRDHFRPFGRQSKDRTPPYYVTFETGEAAWYDASEVEPMRGSAKKMHHAAKKSPAQLQREIDAALATKTSRQAKAALTAAQFNALATQATKTLLQSDFDALLAAVRKLQPKTIVGVRGDYGGKEGVAEGRFIKLVETSPISAPWSRRVIVEEVQPTSRLQTTLRQLDFSPYDLRALPQTKFSRS